MSKRFGPLSRFDDFVETANELLEGRSVVDRAEVAYMLAKSLDCGFDGGFVESAQEFVISGKRVAV